MRLKKKIEERVNLVYEAEKIFSKPEDFVQGVKKNCKPYLRLLAGRIPLVKGTRKLPLHSMGVKDTRQDRIPRAFSRRLYPILNDWLESNGGARRDKSVIGSSEGRTLFGNLFYIFPAGNMNYTFVRSTDINFSNIDYSPKDLDNYLDYLRTFDRDDDIEDIVKKFFGFNEGFDEAYKNGYEIWFQCKYYYFMDTQEKRIF